MPVPVWPPRAGSTQPALLDSTWADPQWCLSGETPLACEYRVTRPSIALIMFGINDGAATEPEAYEAYLRLIVTQTLERKIVPVLHTFPTRPGESGALGSIESNRGQGSYRHRGAPGEL